MRLEPYEIRAIQSAVYKMDPEAEIYLFGSRTDKLKKGGDIDLLIISQSLEKIDSWEIRDEICKQIGEQKIDIVISNTKEGPFVRIALREGVLM